LAEMLRPGDQNGRLDIGPAVDRVLLDTGRKPARSAIASLAE